MATPAFHTDKHAELVRRLKAGDRRAADALYRDLVGKVFGFCMTRVRNREIAEDITQDIFVKFVTKIGTFDEHHGHFLPWFWQMARNTLIDYYREKKELQFADMEEDAVELARVDYFPKRTLAARHEEARVKSFLRTLSDEEQNLFHLRFIAELSYEEMSHITKKSEGSLRVAISRLRAKIKRHFESEL